MGLGDALFTGMSRLDVNQTRLNVIGNNIANANTTAFKSSRALFAPQFYVTDAEATAPTTSPATTTTTSCIKTPSDSSTTPSAGSVSSPVNGGARNAPTHPPMTSSPKTMLLKRWSNRKTKRGPGEALEPADQLRQSGQEALALVARQLELAPALGQPDLVAAGDQLKREQHGDELEHVRYATGRQRKRRHGEQKHEENRKAPLAEEVDEAAQRLVAVAFQPALELVAELLRMFGPLVPGTRPSKEIVAHATRRSPSMRSRVQWRMVL